MPRKKNKFDQWLAELPEPARNLLNRLTVNDVLNIGAFSATAFLTFKGLTALNEISENRPEWYDWLLQFDPVYVFLKREGHLTGTFSMLDRVILSFLAGYGAVKFAPTILSTATTAIPSVITGLT